MATASVSNCVVTHSWAGRTKRLQCTGWSGPSCAPCVTSATASVKNCVVTHSWAGRTERLQCTGRSGPLVLLHYPLFLRGTILLRFEISMPLSWPASSSSSQASDGRSPLTGLPVHGADPKSNGPTNLSSPRLIRSENQSAEGFRQSRLSALPGETSSCFPSEPSAFICHISGQNRHPFVGSFSASPECAIKKRHWYSPSRLALSVFKRLI